MRNYFLAGLMIMAVSMMFSCKKTASMEPQASAGALPLLKPKIESWLDKQKHPEPGRHNEKLALLKTNLDFQHLSIEKKNDKEKFVIVPLAAGYVTENNQGTNPVNQL